MHETRSRIMKVLARGSALKHSRRLILAMCPIPFVLLVVACAILNSPPVAQFTFTLSQSAFPSVAAFDASSSYDPDGIIVKYEWSFGDGSSGTNRLTSHTYRSSGTFPVTLTVTDDDGKTTTATEPVTVQPAYNGFPVARFTVSPESGPAPLLVDLDASASSDLNGQVVTCAWDFGDGSTATGVSASHVFRRTGVHTITLTVTDNDGLATAATQIVSVVAESEAPLRLAGEGSPRYPVPFEGADVMSFFMEHRGGNPYEHPYNFTVQLLDAQRRRVSPLASGIGSFVARADVSGFGVGSYYLDVAADGKWAITVFRRTQAPPPPPRTYHGQGQQLLQYTALFALGPGEARFYWVGVEGAFLLSYDTPWTQPLVDQDSDGKVSVEAPSGIYLVQFMAPSEWQISVEQ